MEHGTGAGPAWALALEHSALGETLRQAMWLYPIANVLHVLAVVAMVGSILAFDLRLMGAAKSLPVAGLARLLLPISAVGFVVAVVTGVLLFTADATAVWNNPVFVYKLALIALGLVNITVFHFGVWRSAEHWPADAPAPLPAVAGAAVSIVAWVSHRDTGHSIQVQTVLDSTLSWRFQFDFPSRSVASFHSLGRLDTGRGALRPDQSTIGLRSALSWAKADLRRGPLTVGGNLSPIWACSYVSNVRRLRRTRRMLIVRPRHDHPAAAAG